MKKFKFTWSEELTYTGTVDASDREKAIEIFNERRPDDAEECGNILCSGGVDFDIIDIEELK